MDNVPDALNMRKNDFEKVFKRPKPSEDTEIIFYCMIGKRSSKAQQNALSLGYKKYAYLIHIISFNLTFYK